MRYKVWRYDATRRASQSSDGPTISIDLGPARAGKSKLQQNRCTMQVQLDLGRPHRVSLPPDGVLAVGAVTYWASVLSRSMCASCNLAVRADVEVFQVGLASDELTLKQRTGGKHMTSWWNLVNAGQYASDRPIGTIIVRYPFIIGLIASYKAVTRPARQEWRRRSW